MKIAANARALRRFLRDGALRWRQRQFFIDCLKAIMRERNSNSRMRSIACGDGPQGRP
jgi:hypothetical protein